MKKLLLILFVPSILFSSSIKIIKPRLAFPDISLKGMNISINVILDDINQDSISAVLFSHFDTIGIPVIAISNPDSNQWIMQTNIPYDIQSDLYSLILNAGVITDTQYNAISVIDSYPEYFSFIQITDPHIGYSTSTSEYLGIAISEINFINPDFVILTGDVAEKGNNPEWYEESIDSLKKLRIPVFCISGNHDWYNWMYMPTDENNYLEIINPYPDYSFTFGNSYFLLMDTGPDDMPSFTSNCYGLNNVQLDWINSKLIEYSGFTNGFVFIHGPFYDDEGSENRYGLSEFIALCDTFNIDMVLCGHTHKNKFFDINGVRHSGNIYPVEGTKYVQTTTNGKGDYEDCGYRLIRIGPDSILNYSVDYNEDGIRDFDSALKLDRLGIQYSYNTDSTNAQAIIINDNNECFNLARLYFTMSSDTIYKCDKGEIVRQKNGQLLVELDSFPPKFTDTINITPSNEIGIRETNMLKTGETLLVSPSVFYSQCKIKYINSVNFDYTISIYSANGRKVKTIRSGCENIVVWKGDDDNDRKLSPGMYFIMIEGKNKPGKKVFLIR